MKSPPEFVNLKSLRIDSFNTLQQQQKQQQQKQKQTNFNKNKNNFLSFLTPCHYSVIYCLLRPIVMTVKSSLLCYLSCLLWCVKLPFRLFYSVLFELPQFWFLLLFENLPFFLFIVIKKLINILLHIDTNKRRTHF
jgi:hypothetical protein